MIPELALGIGGMLLKSQEDADAYNAQIKYNKATLPFSQWTGIRPNGIPEQPKPMANLAAGAVAGYGAGQNADTANAQQQFQNKLLSSWGSVRGNDTPVIPTGATQADMPEPSAQDEMRRRYGSY